MTVKFKGALNEAPITSINSIVIELPKQIWVRDYHEFDELQDTLVKLTGNKKVKVKEIASKPGMEGYGGIIYIALDQAVRDMMKQIKQSADDEWDQQNS